MLKLHEWQNEAKMRNPFNASGQWPTDILVARRYDRTLRLSAVGAGVTGELTRYAGWERLEKDAATSGRTLEFV